MALWSCQEPEVCSFFWTLSVSIVAECLQCISNKHKVEACFLQVISVLDTTRITIICIGYFNVYSAVGCWTSYSSMGWCPLMCYFWKFLLAFGTLPSYHICSALLVRYLATIKSIWEDSLMSCWFDSYIFFNHCYRLVQIPRFTLL